MPLLQVDDSIILPVKSPFQFHDQWCFSLYFTCILHIIGKSWSQLQYTSILQLLVCHEYCYWGSESAPVPLLKYICVRVNIHDRIVCQSQKSSMCMNNYAIQWDPSMWTWIAKNLHIIKVSILDLRDTEVSWIIERFCISGCPQWGVPL